MRREKCARYLSLEIRRKFCAKLIQCGRVINGFLRLFYDVYFSSIFFLDPPFWRVYINVGWRIGGCLCGCILFAFKASSSCFEMGKWCVSFQNCSLIVWKYLKYDGFIDWIYIVFLVELIINCSLKIGVVEK